LTVQKHEIPVKLYSAVLDRQVHFHLLHRLDRTRVQQQWVDAENGRPVPLDETRKAFQTEPGQYVVLTSEDLERIVPEANRDIRIAHFVPRPAIDPQFYDRPYILGPSGDSPTDYFALAEALDRKNCAGIASWVMRKHSYVGALIAQQRYLMLITLRHSDEVIPASALDPPQGRPLQVQEKSLAKKLIEALSGEFRPDDYHDEYEERIHQLIDAKRAGKKIKPKRLPRRSRQRSLVDSLRASLNGASAKRSAGRR
jgi:DNA end-binding protein Ku